MFPESLSPIRTIHLGRLIDYPEWSLALAAAASRSDAWDARRGRSKKSSADNNRLVKMLLNGSAFPVELQTVFARQGTRVCIGSVEKVLVYKAKEFYGQRKSAFRNISPDARLPVDAQIWLKLKPVSDVCVEQ